MSDKKAANRKLTLGVGLFILVVLIVMAANVWRAKKKPAPALETASAIPVTVSPVVKGELDWFTEVAGDLKPMQSTMLFAKVPGKIIEEILVEKGDWVEKGQRVASLEKNQINAQLSRAQAAVEVAQTQVDVLEKDFFRMDNLYKSQTAPKQKLDHIQAELNAAKARLKEAQAAFNELNVLYRDHDMYATQSGIVADRFVDPGNLSNPQAPIMKISNEKELKVEISLPERETPHIRPGMDVTFTTDAWPGRTFSGQVALIYPTVDPMTRTIKAEIHIQNQDLQLRSGMFAHVKLYFGKKESLLIRKEALNQLPGTGSYYVYGINDHVARLINIDTGIHQGNLVEVASGLSEGDRVVIQGQNRLKDNTAVEIVTEKPITAE
jgi:RND family efflux transporter MFP subunit